MLMDSISMCSNTQYMINVDGGSSFRWLSVGAVLDNFPAQK